MVVVIPALWVVIALAVTGAARRSSVVASPFEVVSLATALTGAFAYLALPVLSIGRTLTPAADAAWWVAGIGAVVLLGRREITEGWRAVLGGLSAWTARSGSEEGASLGTSLGTPLRAWLIGRGAGWWAWAAAVVVLAVLTLSSALLYPPLTWDSLAHHMPRVFQIIQNRTVAFFPTFYPTMDTTYPLVAYQIVHLKLLSWPVAGLLGADFGINAVQWPAYLLVAAAVYQIARQLGSSRVGARVASLAAMAAPPVLLQATAEMYDLTVAMWVALAVYAALALVRWTPDDGVGRRGALVASLGLVCGLGLLAKVTFLLFFAPFAVWLAVAGWRAWGGRAVAVNALAAVAIGLALASPWLGMNAVTQRGDALLVNVPGNEHVLAPVRTPSALWANAVRNLGAQLATPYPSVNAQIAAHVVAPVAGLLGTGIDDPANKEVAAAPYQIAVNVTDPEVAGSLAYSVLVLASLIVVLTWSARRRMRGEGRAAAEPAVEGRAGSTPAVVWYVLAWAAGLWLVAALVTWQLLVTRTVVGSLVLAAPLVGFAFDALRAAGSRGARRGRGVGAGVMVAALGVVVAWAVFCASFGFLQPLAPPAWLDRVLPPEIVGNLNRDPASLYGEVPALEEAVNRWAPTLPPGTGVAVVGGNNALLQPVYPIVTALADLGYRVYFDTSAQVDNHLFGADERLNTIAVPAAESTVVLSYDAAGASGTALVAGEPVSTSEGFTLAWESVHDDGSRTTIWVR